MVTTQTELAEWLQAQIARYYDGNVSAFARKVGKPPGVKPSTVGGWLRGARPEWGTCADIAGAIKGATPGMVRRLAGYGEEAAETAVVSSTVPWTPEVEKMAAAVAVADEHELGVLLGLADIVLGKQTRSAREGHPGVDPKPRRSNQGSR